METDGDVLDECTEESVPAAPRTFRLSGPLSQEEMDQAPTVITDEEVQQE